jgi:hypothetical protein
MSYVTLTTDVKNYQKSANITSVASGSPSPTITAAAPHTTVPANSAVIGTSLNYLKVKAYASTTDSVTLTVIGWSYWAAQNSWIPQVLFVCTTTQNSNSQTIPSSGTVYECTQYSKSSGDAKIFNTVASTANGAFFLIDTLGCQFIQFHAMAANTPTVHILTSGV